MCLYWNKVHLSASSEWPLSLGCSEIIFCMLQNSHVEDVKIYLAELPVLQQQECSECPSGEWCSGVARRKQEAAPELS